jgi:MYXO-CTERM domain-containing protein
LVETSSPSLPLSLCTFALLAGFVSPSVPGVKQPAEADRLPGSGLAFEENLGQFDPEVRFAARGPGYAFWLTDAGAKLSLGAGGSNTDGDVVIGLSTRTSVAKLVSSERREARASYFRGRDRTRWIAGAPLYGRVTYQGVEPGIDLVYRGDEGRLEYDFVLASGASVDDAVLEVTGAEGLSIDADGALLIQTRPDGTSPARPERGRGVRTLRQLPPVVYQTASDGTQRRIPGAYRIVDGTRVAFSVGAYDRSRALVIDPVLLYGTYLGGSSFDQASAAAVDAKGNVYVAGFTSSPNFPTAHPTEPHIAGSFDAFVAKLDPTGKDLLYATYLGGSLEDSATAIAVDGTGNAFLTGSTQSADFPTTSGSFQPALAGAANAFVAKLAPDGQSLVYATCLGGMGFDVATGIALDTLGDAYVAGYTQSPDFPTENPFQSTLAGAQNAFVAEIAPDGRSLLAGTYLGGEVDDAANALTLDANGHVWIAGYTQSTWQTKDFPNDHPYQTRLAGTQNAFVATWSPGLTSLDGLTLLGGSEQDAANAIAVDAVGDVYLSGSTTSPDFPTASAFRGKLDGSEDAFVTKLSADLRSVVYSTFLGGSGTDVAAALGLGAGGVAFVAGQTNSSDFPLEGAFQAKNEAPTTPRGNAFVAMLEASGEKLVGSSYWGGRGGASARGLAMASPNTAWVVGASGVGLPVPEALFPAFAGLGPSAENAFVGRISSQVGTPIDAGAPDAEAGTGDGALPPPSDSGGVSVTGPSFVPEPTGCSCRLAPSEASSGGWMAGLFLLFAVRRRRLPLTDIENHIQ